MANYKDPEVLRAFAPGSAATVIQIFAALALDGWLAVALWVVVAANVITTALALFAPSLLTPKGEADAGVTEVISEPDDKTVVIHGRTSLWRWQEWDEACDVGWSRGQGTVPFDYVAATDGPLYIDNIANLYAPKDGA